MRTRPIRWLLGRGLLIAGVIAATAPRAPAAAPPDFTLGAGTLQVGVESDPGASEQCMVGADNSGCDTFKIKIPIALANGNDFDTDIQLPGKFASASIATGSCGVFHLVINLDHTTLVFKKTKGTESVAFTGMANAGAPQETKSDAVPVKFLLKINRKTNKGFITVSGVGDLTTIHNNSAAAFEFIAVEGPDSSDADKDSACGTLTQKNSPKS